MPLHANPTDRGGPRMAEPEPTFSHRFAHPDRRKVTAAAGACLAVIVSAAVAMGASPTPSTSGAGASAAPGASAKPHAEGSARPDRGVFRFKLKGGTVPFALRRTGARDRAGPGRRRDHRDQRLQRRVEDRRRLDADDRGHLVDADHEGRRHDRAERSRGRRHDPVPPAAERRRVVQRDPDRRGPADRGRHGHRQDAARRSRSSSATARR